MHLLEAPAGFARAERSKRTTYRELVDSPVLRLKTVACLVGGRRHVLLVVRDPRNGLQLRGLLHRDGGRVRFQPGGHLGGQKPVRPSVPVEQVAAVAPHYTMQVL